MALTETQAIFDRLLREAFAFSLGLIEFKSGVTTSTDYIEAYDHGRELAHKLTLRRFEQ